MSKGMLLRLVAVVFLGLILGWGSQCRESGQSDTGGDPGSPSTSTHAHGEYKRTGTDLKPRMAFPDIGVTTQEGIEVSTADLIQGRGTIAVFVQIGCGACSDVMEVWSKHKDQIPAGLNVIAFTEDEPQYVKQYAEENNFPFPLYCDEMALFAEDYNMDTYPSMIGIRENGVIAYVGMPVTPEFTPAKAWELLNQVEQGHQEK